MPDIKKRSRLRGKPLLYAVSAFASLGVFLFGYDQGVMSGIITGPYFKAYFHEPDSVEIGTLVSILEVGAFITSLLAAPLADKKGRTFTIFLGACIFVVGGSLQTFTAGYKSMLVGRFISGLGVGLLSMIVPVYQSEVSPAHNRGLLGCVEFTGNVFGYAISVWTDYFSSYIKSNVSWRLPLSVQVVCGIILAAGALLIPESPRFCVTSGRDDEAKRILEDLWGVDEGDESVEKEWKEIRAVVDADNVIGDRSYSALWRRYRGRVLIAMSSQAGAQLQGINVVSLYAPLVFEQAGWIGRDAILMTGINACIYVLSTIPTWFLVDRLGRRPVLMTGAAVMAVALTALGYFLYLDIALTPNAAIVCVVIFNAAFGASWGPLPWLYPPEIMPMAFRAKGVSLSTATNWVFNWWIGTTTVVLQDLIGWRLYPMHAFFCVCSFALVYLLYPETCGVPLEEMNLLFGDEDPADNADSDSDSLLSGDEEDGSDYTDDEEEDETDGLAQQKQQAQRPVSWVSRIRRAVGLDGAVVDTKGKGRGDTGYRAIDQPADEGSRS